MSAKDIRNIVLLGHGGSGKTTLAESMLFMTGGTDRFGKVTDGNTTCDYDAEEIKRNISISLAVAPVKYKNVKINVLDTPGNFDFAGEVLSGIRAAECAVLVCGAKDGLSVGAERAWKMLGNKPRMIVLNRIDMADPALTKKWAEHFRAKGYAVLQTDCKTKKGISGFVPAVRTLLAEKLARYAEKGQVGRPLKLMVVGIPNVGKSTFINQIAGRKGAKAENRPGVTRGKQWITVDQGLLLLDTPGILWPKFEDPEVGMRLAYTGAVKEDVIDTETLACHFIALLAKYYPQTLSERYKLEAPEGADGYDLLQLAGKKRGYLVSGGEVNTERMAKALMDDYRSGKLGKLTLESPEDMQ